MGQELNLIVAFVRLCEAGSNLDVITFVSLLFTRNHVALVGEGCNFFDMVLL